MIIMRGVLFLLLGIGGGALALNPPEYTQGYKAWIDIKSDNSHLKIKAFCRSQEDSFLRYELKARKRGKTGKTKTFQSGPVHIKSQEEKCLSKLSLGVSPEDEYEIRLEVYKDGRLIAEDSVIYPQRISGTNGEGLE